MVLKVPLLNSLRKSGIAFIGDIPWGTHICGFYETKGDLIDILIPYLKAGLESNEYCLWIVSEPISTLEAASFLKDAIPASYLQQIEILPHTEWYLEQDEFQGDRIVRGWAEKVNYALAMGYDGLRVCGSTTWLTKRSWKKFMDYEAAVEREIGRLNIIALCPYQLSRCGLQQVLDLVSNHQFSFIKSAYDWKNKNSMARFNCTEIIGKMAAGVVHEIRNPIASVRGFIQLLRSKENLDEYDGYFDLIIDELDRANGILTEYLSLARDDKHASVKRQNLNDILVALLPLLQADARKEDKNIQLKTGNIMDVLVVPQDIRQVVLNLARNGLEAMPKGGVLEIRTYMEENAVVLEVEDSGKGIPEDIMESLGKPFLTTKDHGTGLGLFICFKILESYRAKVAVDSSPAGTRFTIRFPLSPSQPFLLQ